MSASRFLGRWRSVVLGMMVMAAPSGLQAGQAPDGVPPLQVATAVVNRSCVSCHNQRMKTGGLVLEGLDLMRPADTSEIWEKVIRKVRAGLMPPPNGAKPDPAALAGLVSWLETSIDAAAAAAPSPGRPVVHRLNRAEYTNAVRDLLGVDIDSHGLLPADDSGHGFDNVADVLSVSPSLLERYLLAAKKVSRLALGDPTIPPAVETYSVPLSRVQDVRMSEDLPFGTRGGLAVRHTFAVDGEYDLQIRLQGTPLNRAQGLRGRDEDNVIDVRFDGVLVKRFTIPRLQRSRPAPGAPDEDDPAESLLRARVPVKAGAVTIAILFPSRSWYVEGEGVSRLPAFSDGFQQAKTTGVDRGRIQMGIGGLEVTGPFNAHTPDASASRRRIFVCRPAAQRDETPCARRVLSILAKRAYRRPLTPEDVQTLLKFYAIGRGSGTFEQGVQAGIEGILVSPYFLLRKEQEPGRAGTVHRVSPLDLASRLSFFLWSSIPDDRLIELAASGRLADPATLESEVRRMLRDPRADALLSNFFGQWLYLRNVSAHRPDEKSYPEFDDNLREAFQEETRLFLEAQLREDRPVTELLTADYTFVNERLAKHYGIPAVYGSQFRRVPLTDDRRAGLLGHGAILMVTSYPNRTSPVVRGKWLLENILGAPPPAPPADVPPFPERQPGEAPKSVRQRLEQHRRNPVCASCHANIDPLGFGLENFDGIGQFRTTDEGAAVDASGTLPGGATFAGPSEFRRALVSKRELLVTTLAEKLLTYALGRGVEHYDMPAVRAIVRDAAAADYRWSSLIMAIVRSTPFTLRRSGS